LKHECYSKLNNSVLISYFRKLSRKRDVVVRSGHTSVDGSNMGFADISKWRYVSLS